jgi:hypothetical protein
LKSSGLAFKAHVASACLADAAFVLLERAYKLSSETAEGSVSTEADAFIADSNFSIAAREPCTVVIKVIDVWSCLDSLDMP